MKRHLLTCIALCSAMLGAMAQRSYTFNAVALNVDGLPKEILTFSINPDGKEEAGATELCGILANSGWDIVGFSEDFNFHDELTAAPASTYYNFGQHGGEVLSTSNSTDGLGIAVAKHLTFPGAGTTGTKVAWKEYYGGSGLTTIGDNGADNMITKGFRMYTVTIAEGVAVDVYVLHMDASTADSDDDYENGKDKNIIAREAQLKQLADYIIANHNNRPVIIIGDTNCRYTREQLKTGFIDYINADSHLTIKDAWVELMWGGVYPTYEASDMTTNNYGPQKGEVVDKVFYINTTESNLTLEANSYLHDVSVTTSDHFPVKVNFTITDPNGEAIDKKEMWTVDEGEASFQKPLWKGEQVVSGTTYYVMNVGTGKYIKWGGFYNAQAVSGYAGHPITPTLNGDKYELVTRPTSEGRALSNTLNTNWDAKPKLFMDDTSHPTWTLTPVNGTSYQYYIETESGALGLSDDQWQTLLIESKNASDDTQKWIFLTEAGMIAAMADANPDYPFNFTPMLGAADFDVVDDWGGYAKEHWTNFESYCAEGYVQWGSGQSLYNSSAMIVSTPDAVTISQAISGLPTGNYKFSFEGFYNYLLTTTTTTETRTRSKFYSNWGDWTSSTSTSTSEQTMTATVTVGSETFTLSPNRSVNVGDLGAASIAFRDGDTYMTTTYQTLSSDELNISIAKPATTTNSTGSTTESGGGTFDTSHTKTTPSYAYTNSVYFDNFRLEYRGTQTVAIDPYEDYKKIVRDKLNETYEKVILLNEQGQTAYDVSEVIYRYNENLVTTAEKAEDLCTIVDKAYTDAYMADHILVAKMTIDAMSGNNVDITKAIMNHSFEKGDDTGWTYNIPYYNDGGNPWGEFGAYTYGTTGMDGSYVFNNYSSPTIWWNWAAHSPVSQTITNVPNGLYRLTALVASDEGRNVYVVGENYYAEAAAINANTFAEISVDFLVENGSATIKACASNTDINNGAYYWPDGGWWYKADNFRLTYLCDEAHGRVKLAMDKAKATTLDIYGADAFDISDIEDKYNNGMVSDGVADAQEITDRLRAAAKRQNQAGADMTAAIVNPSFETGDLTGWEVETVTDTKVVPQSNATYAALDADGRYLFNNWNGDGENDIDTPPITQTITDIVNGTYRLTAKVASHADRKVYLIANDKVSAVTTTDKTRFVTATVEFTVTNNTATIGVVGGDINNSGAYNEAGGGFYKCDDFQLTLVTPSQLRLYQDAGVVEELNDVTYPAVVMNRPIKAKDSKGNPAWASFVAPFAIPALNLNDWDIMELTGAEYKESSETLSLTFSGAADGIKAGVPYMVRNTNLTENFAQISMSEVSVNTVTQNDTEITITNGNGSTVTFKGVYTAGNVPQGAFFISDNTFYQAADGTNTIKGFRAYLEISGSLASKARSMSFRWDDGTTSIDNGQLTNDNEVTTVAIYNEKGIRLTEMQQGINILLMSDGTTVKVVIR